MPSAAQLPGKSDVLRLKLRGLTKEEAARRLREEGFNELPTARRRSALRLLADILREPMIAFLAVTAIVYAGLGDRLETIAVLVAVLLVIGLEFTQQSKSDRALEALRQLSSPRALVVRDGEHLRISGREVVRDDIVVLLEGDRVPADGVVLSALNLLTDESLLTGESQPVEKLPGGANEEANVFSGTLVVRGHGVARVTAIGSATDLGKIGRSLQQITPQRSTLQKQVAGMVRIAATLAVTLCVAAATLFVLTRGGLLRGLLAGLTLAISLLPEELPVVLTIFFALGAWRMAQRNVLTRRPAAIETLGSVTVLCVDKTGTITRNHLTASRVVPTDGLNEQEVLRWAALASRREAFDPLEVAIHEATEKLSLPDESLDLLREYPLTPEAPLMSRAWTIGGRTLMATKGAPEAVLPLCRLSPRQHNHIVASVDQMANAGLRVLAIGAAELTGPPPESQLGAVLEYCGIIGFEDAIRPDAPAAIAECRRAGVRVVMATGDHPATARSIATQAGLDGEHEVITGTQIDAMSAADLRDSAKRCDVFARVSPEKKLRLVQAFRDENEIVGMTGDGVNDGPALKAAHIGIAMGQRGTDVAREAASLILLRDDFPTIVEAIRLGRRIYQNLRKAMAYVFAIHVPIAGIAIAPLLFGWPIILMPLHVLLMELVIDPACTMAFEVEGEERDLMRHPPRPVDEHVLGRALLLRSLLEGATLLAVTLVVFATAQRRGLEEGEVRALTYASLLLGNLALLWSNRSWSLTIVETLRRVNLPLYLVTSVALLILAAATYVPVLQRVFAFSAMHADDWLIAAGAAAASVTWFEIYKVFHRKREERKAAA